MLNHFASTYNFTFVMSGPPDGKWGGLLPHGKAFFGLIAALSTALGDVGIGDFFQMLPRTLGVSISLYGRGGTSFVVPVAKEIPNWMAVANIFDTATWLVFLVALVLVVVAWRATRYVEFKLDPGKKIEKTSERLVWPDLVAQGLAAIMRKVDYTEEPVFLKLVMNIWILMGFFFGSIFFKSIFIQKLTAVEFDTAANSASDIVTRKIPIQFSEMSDFFHGVYPQYGINRLGQFDEYISVIYKTKHQCQGTEILIKSEVGIMYCCFVKVFREIKRISYNCTVFVHCIIKNSYFIYHSRRPKQTFVKYSSLVMNLVPPSSRFFFNSGPKKMLSLSWNVKCDQQTHQK